MNERNSMEKSLGGLIGTLEIISDGEDGSGGVESNKLDNAASELSELLADGSWLTSRFRVPRPEKSIQYLLYGDPTSRFSVVAVVFDVGFTTQIHDHGTWGLVGVIQGVEQEERFEKLETGTEDGRVRLAAKGVVQNRRGDLSRILPPKQEIHRISTVGDTASCSVHVYGADLNNKPRHRFDLETGLVSEYITEVVNLWE